MKPPTIREARAPDKEELVRMRLMMQEHMEASNPNIWRMTEEGKNQIGPDVEQMLSDTDGLVLMSEEDGAATGFAYGHVDHRTTYTPRNIGHIHTIYVKKPHRRRGIGSRLIRELCRFFRAQDIEEANLMYVLGNTEGEEFWSALGFKPVIQTANTSLEALEELLEKRLEKRNTRR